MGYTFLVKYFRKLHRTFSSWNTFFQFPRQREWSKLVYFTTTETECNMLLSLQRIKGIWYPTDKKQLLFLRG